MVLDNFSPPSDYLHHFVHIIFGTTFLWGENMPLPSFLKQTVMRTGIIFLVKAIGLTVRIPLFRLLGSEGAGIYQMVYSIFGFALTLIVGGFPTSLALMTAKKPGARTAIF
ncbi:oligosaccharide flippase family protein [Paenibacillus sp. JTLBN-2024]